MTISSINLAMTASSYGAYTQKLTQATKQKLEELGIYYDENTTESEAKRLIQKAQEVQQNEQAENQNTGGQNQASNNDLMQKAIKLAEKVGVDVEENIDFDTLIAQIEEALENKINANQSDVSALKELQGLAQELANIQAQSNGSSGYDNTNQALMQSLEMLSEYNKNYLLH